MRRNSVAVIVCIFLLGVAGSAQFISEAYAASTCTLTVTVKNEYNQKPVVGANVSISGPVNILQVTGNSGVVTFSNIPTGTYQLLTSAVEFPSKESQTIQLTGDQSVVVLFGYTKAFFTYSPENITANSNVFFNASTSSSTGNITSYSWNFGDGTTGTGIYPTHNYTQPGSYTAVLTVTSTHGTATYSLIIPVAESSQPWPFPWILLIIPFLIPIPILLLYRRRRYYVVIQARVPIDQKHLHCPGDGTLCEDCKLTPC